MSRPSGAAHPNVQLDLRRGEPAHHSGDRDPRGEGIIGHDPSIRYQLRSLPGDFSGLQLLCLEFVGFKIVDPTVDIGFDIGAEYEEARAKS